MTYLSGNKTLLASFHLLYVLIIVQCNGATLGGIVNYVIFS